MENESKGNAAVSAQREMLDRRRLSANNIVALDYGRHSNRFTRVIILLVHSDNPSVRANEDFGAACNFRRQGEREINFGAGSEIFLHHKVNAARQDRKSTRLN